MSIAEHASVERTVEITVICPRCHASNGTEMLLRGRTYAGTCNECEYEFEFNADELVTIH